LYSQSFTSVRGGGRDGYAEKYVPIPPFLESKISDIGSVPHASPLNHQKYNKNRRNSSLIMEVLRLCAEDIV
jgi:hypothetical protein